MPSKVNLEWNTNTFEVVVINSVSEKSVRVKLLKAIKEKSGMPSGWRFKNKSYDVQTKRRRLFSFTNRIVSEDHVRQLLR